MTPYVAPAAAMVHAAWVLWMIGGFFFTVAAFFRKSLWDWTWFRTLHLIGIVCVAILAVAQVSCPLTILENAFKGPEQYSGSFLVYYIEKFLYPDVPQGLLLAGTVFIAIFTAVVFVLRPPISPFVRHRLP